MILSKEAGCPVKVGDFSALTDFGRGLEGG